MNIQLLLSANQGQEGLSPTLPPSSGSPRTAQIFLQVLQAASSHQADNRQPTQFNHVNEKSASADYELAEKAFQNVTKQWQVTKQILISDTEALHTERHLSATVISSDTKAFSTTKESIDAQTNSPLANNSNEREASMAISEAASRLALIASYSAQAVSRNEVILDEQSPLSAETTLASNKAANALPKSRPSREAEVFTASFFESALSTTSSSFSDTASANAPTLNRQIKNQVQESGQTDNEKAPSFALGPTAAPLLPIISTTVMDATFKLQTGSIDEVDQPLVFKPLTGLHTRDIQPMADLMTTEYSAAKKDAGPALSESPTPIATTYPSSPTAIPDAPSAVAPLPSLVSAVTLQENADKAPRPAGLAGVASPLQQKVTHALLSTSPAVSPLSMNIFGSLTNASPLATIAVQTLNPTQPNDLTRLPLDTMLKLDNSSKVDTRHLLEVETIKKNPNIIKNSELSTPTLQPSTQQAIPNSSATITLSTPAANPAWPSQLGKQLVQFAQRNGEHQVKMQLHPVELGSLSISLKVGEQGAQVHFLTASAQARQVIELAIPQLREALAEQGISLGETSVGEHNNPNEQSFAQQGSGGTPSSSGGSGSKEESDGSLTLLEGSNPLALDGHVDLYA